MKNQERFFLSLSLVTLLSALGALTPCAAGSTVWTVHPMDPMANCTTIQDAITNATDGDYIEVWNSTYTENIYVNKSLTIYARDGTDVTIVEASNPNEHVFEVTADWVNISGFTVKNATESEIAGIFLHGVEHCTISDNNVTNNDIGIALIQSSHNTIRDNRAESNINYGFYLESSSNNIITHNTACFTEIMAGISLTNSSDNRITNNIANSNLGGGCGIELVGEISCNNTIDNNIASSNDGAGIIFWIWTGSDFYDNNTITNNTASYNGGAGIELQHGSRTNITNNTANSNGGPGIVLCSEANNNTIENNTVSHNEYSGIELIYNTTYNIIKNNTARHNKVSGIALYHSSSDNTVSNNELHSNQFGVSIARVAVGYNPGNNQIANNTISGSKSHGVYLLDLMHANNVTNNNVSNSNLFGILVENSANSSITITNNTVTSNERGIGLLFSMNIQLINNTANSNTISGFSVVYSDNNNLFDNQAHCNTYEGIYLSNSSINNITRNTISSSYFGISLYNSSNHNTITNNDASTNYYFEVFNDSSCIGNDIDVTPYSKKEITTGVRVYLREAGTPSLQSVDPARNATYDIVVENLGNMPETFDLIYSCSNDHYAVSLDKNSVSLGPGTISADTTLYEIAQRVKMNVETIKLIVSGTEPGVCRVTIKAISKEDLNVSDRVETWTIVQGIDTSSSNDSTSIILDSALIENSSVTDHSTVNRSAIINSTISHSTITDSIIINTKVAGTPLPSGVILEDADVNSGYISSGIITVNDTAYEITHGIKLADLVPKSDDRDSDLVGIQEARTLDLYAGNSNVSFNISAKDDYFAGSLRVQKSEIPPNGIPEFSNSVGGYVYVNASDNLANSTGWVMIKVFYEKNELGDLDPSSLTLTYYNESALNESGLLEPKWENVPIAGREENYVWGNISHYSVFAISGSVTPKGAPTKTGIPGGSYPPSDDDNDGALQYPGDNHWNRSK